MSVSATASDLARTGALPAALVDLDAFDRNLDRAVALARATGKTLRIATKSVRVTELLRRVINTGFPVHGLMTYSARELLFLATDGFDNLLMGYPTAVAADVECFREALKHGKRVIAMADSEFHLRLLSDGMKGSPRPLKVVLDVDASLRFFGLHIGVRRSPLRTVEAVVKLARLATQLPGLEFEGVMAYEAQVAGVGDRSPFGRLMNGPKSLIRRLSRRHVARLRRAVVEALKAESIVCPLVNGGGTGSLNWTAEEPWVTEVTLGSGLLCGHLFDYYSNIRWEPSLHFALPAMRSSDPGFVTCFGGGYVSSGEPGWDKVPRPAKKECQWVGMEGCGEVQTPLQVSGREPALGDAVLFRPAKSGELAERFPEYTLIQNGRPDQKVKTYRGAGQCFG